jgi:WD40 repeat protein
MFKRFANAAICGEAPAELHSIVLHSLLTGELHELPTAGERMRFAVFSPDEQFLAAANEKGEVQLWETGTFRTLVLRRHNAGVRALRFSPDGRWLASAGEDMVVSIWPVAAFEGVILPRSCRIGLHD